jgi:branched-chain amino acid aminotransferase
LSKRHSERLRQSALSLGFDLPYSIDDIEEMKKLLIEKNGYSQGYVRLVAWVEPPYNPRRRPIDGVRVAGAVWDWGNYYATKDVGVRLKMASWRRPHPSCAPFEAKAAGLYTICTLAKHDTESAGFGDALMLDWQGLVAEATSSNVFFVRDSELHTPMRIAFLMDLHGNRSWRLRAAEAFRCTSGELILRR